ncbi:MAG TPA: sterol desaturase family protein [Povalibacter sp.]|nr:sterol desaturase family protein [Povalibacter sp.]
MNPVLVVVGAAAVLVVLEGVLPNVQQPRVRGWPVRVAILNAAQIAVVYLGASTWDRWLPQLRLWNGEACGQVVGILWGYLAITFVYYWWHRARHESEFLWRWLHQVHHSPARIEVFTSFYKHPFELLANGLLSSAVLHVVVGLTPASAAIVVAITGVAELVYHCNLRTPYWLGFIFQRPESHRRHHEIEIHRGNYSDLPLWDMLFGTFDNPRGTPRECGFGANRERRLLQMLLGRTP